MLRVSAPRGGFRPSARSRVRIAVGVLLSLAAIGVILMVFATADRRVPVMQALGDVPAGSQISVEMFRTVEVSAEPSLQVVRVDDLDQYVGSYAKVRIAAGTLLSPFHVQSDPLVGPNAAVVAINVDQGLLPVGLRERSQVRLVFTKDGSDVVPPPVTGRVVGVPSLDDTTGTHSVSVELAAVDAETVAGAEVVRVVLLEPGVDAASEAGS
jgi:SAF domain